MTTLEPGHHHAIDEIELAGFREGSAAAMEATEAASDAVPGTAPRAATSRRTKARLTAGLIAWDALIPVALLALSAQMQSGGVSLEGNAAYPNDKLAVLLALLSPLALACAGAYHHRRRRGDSRLFFGTRLLLVGVVLSWVSISVAGLAGWPVDHGQMLLLAIAMPAGWLLGRAVCDRHPAVSAERVLLVGSGEVAERVLELTRRHREQRLTVVGRVEDDASGRSFGAVPLLGGVDDLPNILASTPIDRVIVGFVPGRDATLVGALRSCVADGVQVDVVPRLFDLVGRSPRAHALGGMALVEVPGRGLSRVQRTAKRTFDIVGSLALIVCLSPFMLASAVAIAVSDGRPILFRQRRVGRGGCDFSVMKFRTMRTDGDSEGIAALVARADSGEVGLEEAGQIQSVVQALKGDSDRRVFPVGSFLRRSSLDELPQLFNVLIGDMSLVGPRPLRPFEIASLEPWQLARQELRPGLTGLWQVLGRSDIEWDERMQLDYSYVSHWSFASDARILARTLPAVLRKDGAV